MVGGRTGWTVSCFTNARRRTGPPAGKRGMVRVGGSASRTISDSDTPDPVGGPHPAWKQPKDDTHGPDGPRMHMVSQFWGVSLRLKRIAAIVRCRSVLQLWKEKIQTWTRSGAQSGMGSHQAPLGRIVRAPRRRMRPAGKQRAGATGDARQGE